MNENKSITKNYLINLIKTMMTIIFPIITFPYASRILGTSGIGKVNFSNSIISYFLLLSSLGISTYAIREGAKYRDNKEELSKFTTEILIINLFSTLISYLLLIIVVYLFQNIFSSYNLLICIVSLSIITTTLNIEWFYNIMEDYGYITIRAIVFQVLSLLALFLFVKSKDDYYIYAIISIFSSTGTCFFNLIHSRKYIKLFKKQHYSIKRHLKPIFIIFGTSIAATIYLNIDTTMIGIFKSDNEVGLYTAAIKINKMICSLLSSVCTVILPRLSYYIFNGQKEKFNTLCIKAANIILIFSIPAAVGMFMLSKDIIEIFSGIEFINASILAQILAPNIVFSTINGFISYQIFIPLQKEKYALFATIFGATFDCLLNLILIPLYGAAGAAFATLIAEFVVFIISVLLSINIFKIKNIFKYIPQYLFASSFIIGIKLFINQFHFNIMIDIFLCISVSCLIYFAVLAIVKNQFFLDIVNKFLLKKRSDLS